MDRNENPAADDGRGVAGEITTVERTGLWAGEEILAVAFAAVVFRMAPTHGLDARPPAHAI